MFKKYDEAIGLEIGDGLVKALHILSNEKENKLVGLEMVAVNFREGRQGIINAIQSVMGKLALKNKRNKVNISVTGESVMVRDIHWPQMSDDEIKKALKFEVERQVHFKSEDIVFDYYSVMDKSIAETKTRVILVAAKKDLIENYVGLVNAAGYNCGFVEVDTFSLLNCFYVNGPKVALDHTIALINVGMEVTNIDIVKGKIVGLTKDAFVAWSNLIDALPPEIELDFINVDNLKNLLGTNDFYDLCMFVMNALSNQVRRAIEFYESQGRDTVEEIYLSGKIAQIKNLDVYLQNNLGLKVTVWNPLGNVQCDEKLAKEKKVKESAQMLALCAGLACYRSFDINLAGEKVTAKKSKALAVLAKYRILIASAGLVLFFLISLWIFFISQIKIKERAISSLLQENKKLDQILADIDRLKIGRQTLNNHMSIARDLFLRRIQWSKKLYQISKALPKSNWIVDLSLVELAQSNPDQKKPANALTRFAKKEETAVKTNYALTIKGVVYSKESESMVLIINDFINALKADPDFSQDFTSIEMVRSFRDVIGDASVMKYELSCVLK